jgi:hypothetical protein
MSTKEVMGMTTSLLDPMPDMEVLGHPLDLGRPELKELMNRYSCVTPRAQTALLGPPSALIVTNHPGDDAPVREALENEGWFVRSCLGPGKGDCPVMRGERCPLRESVDAAVVFVDPNRLAGGLGTIPRLRCAADSASPGVVAVEGGLEPTRYGRGTACVGALRGPTAVLDAISALLGSREP